MSTDDDDGKHLIVSATIITDDHNKAAKAVEVLARAATGLALEGLSVAINVNTIMVVEDEGDD